MTSKIGFLTPVTYSNSPVNKERKLLEKIDHYLYLGKRVAKFIRKENQVEYVTYKTIESSTIEKIAKIFSYCTLILPLLALATKAILRAKHTFKLIELTPQEDYQERLREFHNIRNIVNPRALLEIDPDKLNVQLDLDKVIQFNGNDIELENDQKLDFRFIIKDIVNDINQAIPAVNDRKVYIETPVANQPIFIPQGMGLMEGILAGGADRAAIENVIKDAYQEALTKLQEKQVIFAYERLDALYRFSFMIQA